LAANAVALNEFIRLSVSGTEKCFTASLIAYNTEHPAGKPTQMVVSEKSGRSERQTLNIKDKHLRNKLNFNAVLL